MNIFFHITLLKVNKKMSDFLDSEAEESDEDFENIQPNERKDDSDDEDEDEDAGIDENEINDIINDEPEEEQDENSDEDEDLLSSRKRKHESDEDDVDEDDLDLIQENTGIKIRKKKHSRVKLLDSDDEEADRPPQNERDKIAHDIFDADDNDEVSVLSDRPESRHSHSSYKAVEVGDEESGDEVDDFIVDDEDQPIRAKKSKKKSVSGRYTDSALQDAQDIFGLEFDLSELEPESDDLGEGEFDEDLDEEELAAKIEQRKARKKASRKSIYDIYDPTELERSHLTLEDNRIKITDVPERFQLRAIPVQQVSNTELEEEAEWIYKQAFMQPPISQQNFQDPVDATKQYVGFEPKGVTAIPRIRAALGFMKKDLFEVPFIAMYRKEYVEPELKKEDLWKVYEWDEKYTQFSLRKNNLKRLFKDMQTYQFDISKKNSDEPLKDDFRLLEQEDIDRLENAQSLEELMDIYLHFQLYYGDDVPNMHEWKKQKKPLKKTKKKVVRVKKVKTNKIKEVDPETGETATDSENVTLSGEVKNVEKSSKDLDNEEDNEEEYEEKEIDVTDSEASENDLAVKKENVDRKLPRKRTLYTICKDNGLLKMASNFGLTAAQFGENLRDNYQRHEPIQFSQTPLEAAESLICNTFPSAEAVLTGARHMVAMQISRDTLVKQNVRQMFIENAKIYITPTKKGKKEIDNNHPNAPFKYLKSKPLRDLHGEQFLKMWHAEQENLVKMRIMIGQEQHNQGFSYLDEIKQLYYRDEFSLLVQEWNKQRSEALSLALSKMLYPMLEKELKAKLLRESIDFAIQACTRKLHNWISVAPYQPDSNQEGEYSTDNESIYGSRVLSCSFLPDRNAVSFFAMLDADGQVVDFLRLKYLLCRKNSVKKSEQDAKIGDMNKLKDFIRKYSPRVVAVAAECCEAQRVLDDITEAVQELEQDHQMPHIYVELVPGEVARIYQNSPRGLMEFPEYPELLRHAISLGRRIQNPLVEFAGLCNFEEELTCLRLHPMQDVLPTDLLQRRLEIEFINEVNLTGVDINRALDFPHMAVLTQFLCGLGPRKAGHLLKTLRQQGLRLENRSQLVTVCEMGLQVFLNCAGFIRIEPSEANDKYEVLDGTRIHPETYDWPRKMAIDALEYDDGMEESNPSSAVEEILEQPDRLKDLDLDAFAEELARQGYGNKQITLYDIRDELINRFKDHRPTFKGLSIEERFQLLTGETQQSLYYGKMITCVVTGFACKKPTREQLDSANPTRNDETNLWRCPFCLRDNFFELSEVWTHFDNGSCPGQSIGVRTRLENGINGFISTKNISDKGCKRPEERVKVGMTLHARVIKINYERIQVDLTCKTSDLTDAHGNFSSPRDMYYDQEAADKDKKAEELLKIALTKRTTYVKRVIAHPSFKNVTFKDAEKLLETMDQGECIVRPSSKGTDHLTVTWKVDNGIYQHIDVREEGKENAFSIGRSLWIDNEEYEDLDEVMAHHISPMATHTRELLNHKYYKETGGVRAKLEEILTQEKRKTPGRIPYFFASNKQYPGKFMLGYMPRLKPKIEFVTVTRDGFRYRGRIHANTNNLLKWFKEHFRDPIPGVGTPLRRTPHNQTPMSIIGSTPYTPGATPSNLISEDEAAKLLQQAFPAGFDHQMYNSLTMTPARSTPGFSTPGSFSIGNLTPLLDNRPTEVEGSFAQWANQGQNYGGNSNNKFKRDRGGKVGFQGRGGYQGNRSFDRNRSDNQRNDGQRRHRR
ncbi:transcription elongation factor SPT6 isoform X2 [Hydra vulgaris]|uniref:Transcription elongation factor SPT6 isoform X2 n=1 Tax=Hydra vulgaris TaxID=6087 RepID=A0ABM4CP53_HYDVU